jgi:hypothetical protein
LYKNLINTNVWLSNKFKENTTIYINLIRAYLNAYYGSRHREENNNYSWNHPLMRHHYYLRYQIGQSDVKIVLLLDHLQRYSNTLKFSKCADVYVDFTSTNQIWFGSVRSTLTRHVEFLMIQSHF